MRFKEITRCIRINAVDLRVYDWQRVLGVRLYDLKCKSLDRCFETWSTYEDNQLVRAVSCIYHPDDERRVESEILPVHSRISLKGTLSNGTTDHPVRHS